MCEISRHTNTYSIKRTIRACLMTNDNPCVGIALNLPPVCVPPLATVSQASKTWQTLCYPIFYSKPLTLIKKPKGSDPQDVLCIL